MNVLLKMKANRLKSWQRRQREEWVLFWEKLRAINLDTYVFIMRRET